jgi:hypothetical protein
LQQRGGGWLRALRVVDGSADRHLRLPHLLDPDDDHDADDDDDVPVCNSVEAVGYVHFAWSTALQIVICVYLIFSILGVSALAGLGFMVVSVPITALACKRIEQYQQTMMEKKVGMMMMMMTMMMMMMTMMMMIMMMMMMMMILLSAGRTRGCRS